MTDTRYKFLGELRWYDIYKNLLLVSRWFNRVGSSDCFLRHFGYEPNGEFYEDYGVEDSPHKLDEVLTAIEERREAGLNVE